MKRTVFLAACCFFPGCALLAPDLVSQGVYRLEAAEVGSCRLAVTAEAEAGRLLVEGVLAGKERFPYPLAAEAVVSLVAPDGSEAGRTRAALRRSRVRRGGGTHAYFTAGFDRVPPPGTLIRVRPQSPDSPIPGCEKPAGG